MNPAARKISRRRFFAVSGALAFGAVCRSNFALAESSVTYSWAGEVMGALSSVKLVLPDGNKAERAKAEKIVQLCELEAKRLERIFSLFIPGSTIRTLNKEGYITNPPAELVSVVEEALRLSVVSDGAFDITIQPLWSALYYAGRDSISNDDFKRLKALVDYQQISCSTRQIRLGKKGAQITLNGIAQGFITDRIVCLLREQGVQNVLVQMGESYALGRNSRNLPWNIGLECPDLSIKVAKEVEISNAALATSGGYGTPFNEDGTSHHLIDARSGKSANIHRSISVQALSATIADGLSTTLFLLPGDHAPLLLGNYTGAQVVYRA